MSEAVSHTVLAPDGLRLHVRLYGAGGPEVTTVLCLPGLARTAADFDTLARHLVAEGAAGRVLALDYRGRGLSERDPDPAHYDLPVESDDILAVCDALGVARAVVVGTSRGGLHAMMLAAVRPSLLRGVVMNDIGPVLEPLGLRRIQGYVGKMPEPANWPEAVAALKAVAGAQFTGMADGDWQRFAETTWLEENGRLLPRYDPALMHNLGKLDPDQLPVLWPQFEALRYVPMLVVRGGNSDLLSADTVRAMTERHPDCAAFTVEGQGHAPLLNDAPTLAAITRFVARCALKAVSDARVESALSLLS